MRGSRILVTPPSRTLLIDGREGIAHVPEKGGGKQPRDRNNDGRWLRKRSDAGRSRKKRWAGAFAGL